MQKLRSNRRAPACCKSNSFSILRELFAACSPEPVTGCLSEVNEFGCISPEISTEIRAVTLAADRAGTAQGHGVDTVGIIEALLA